MDYRNTTGAIGVGIGFALMFALMNGLSTYLFNGETISEVALNRFGGSNGWCLCYLLQQVLMGSFPG